MKTLIFILLKIGEICLIPLTYVLLCVIGYYTNPCSVVNTDWYHWVYFSSGLLIILSPILLFCFYKLFDAIIPKWIAKNKEWSGGIYNKLRK